MFGVAFQILHDRMQIAIPAPACCRTCLRSHPVHNPKLRCDLRYAEMCKCEGLNFRIRPHEMAIYLVREWRGHENAPNPFANHVNDSMVMILVKHIMPIAWRS